MRRPKAAAYRGACCCGWRGPAHPIDWDQVPDNHLHQLDVSAAYQDWSDHMDAVDRQTVPLPDALTDTLGKLENQLFALAEQAPMAALERLTGDVGREAAHAVQADELSWETIGQALGASAAKARSRVTGYLLRG